MNHIAGVQVLRCRRSSSDGRRHLALHSMEHYERIFSSLPSEAPNVDTIHWPIVIAIRRDWLNRPS